jgi:hypothetical protein
MKINENVKVEGSLMELNIFRQVGGASRKFACKCYK